MDFGSLLYKAQKNEQTVKQSNNFYKTSVAPPKKEQREKKLSVNIQKFLARKEEEEKQKKIEFEEKKQKLLSLRNEDKKSLKRVQSMLKRTKSANKSVIDDAIDNVNTAVTAAGPLQPDEDDYGYVSKHAEDLYNNLMKKYSSMPPEEPKFSKSSVKSSHDITKTMNRVKAALQKEEDEKLLPRKRKKKSTLDEGGEEDHVKSEDEDASKEIRKEPDRKDSEKKPKSDKFRIPKKNVAAPPPIDFQSLLKLAEQKQHEPIVIEKQIEDVPDRPMTKKEKEEYLRERARRLRREAAENDDVTKEKDSLNKNPGKVRPELKEQSFRQSEKLSTSSEMSKKEVSTKKIPKIHDAGTIVASKETSKIAKNDNERISKVSKDHFNVDTDKRVTTLKHGQSDLVSKHPKQKSALNASENERKLSKTTGEKIKNFKTLEKTSFSKTDSFKTLKIGANAPSVRQFPPADVGYSSTKPFKNQTAKRYPATDDRKLKPIRRPVIASDDEYDSDMDDFIDDSEDYNDVSQHIRDMFGYDKRKYVDDDDDDECMESNFSQLQKEEYISTRQGILEDLADVRREKREKQRKKLR